MPKLKQPASLQDMAMERLVRFSSQLCVTVSRTGDLDRLRRIVLFIKGYAAPQIPSHLHAEFYNPILRRLWSDESELPRHPLNHQEMVLEMIMDVKIAGLECELPRLPLCLSKADRIQGLRRLTIREKEVFRSLEKFHLDHLRYLEIDLRCQTTWSNEDLRMIAQKCPMLEHLTIGPSKDLTDAELRALASCSNLRSISFLYGSRTSLSAMDQFLSAPGRNREMPVYWEPDNSETAVYRFIECLNLDYSIVTNEDLQTMVAKFPNLRHFRVADGGDIRNWHVLSGLEKLSSLEFDCDAIWTDVVPLLRHIGANLRKLVISMSYPYSGHVINQARLNLLYKLCPNVEYLDIITACRHSTLVVPQFRNLAYLKCHNYASREDGVLQFSIDDGAKLKLEALVVLGFKMDTQMVEMMLDHRRFPNLSKITIEENFETTGKIDRLRVIAKINNLDLEFDQEYWELPE